MYVDLLRGYIEIPTPGKGFLRRKMSGEKFPQALEPLELVLESGVLPIIPLRYVGIDDRDPFEDLAYQPIPVRWSPIIESESDFFRLLS